uniref:hypothetical protein n=1 Tax=Lactiplantibacillus plantarum TaxID=1590 RepID=UPI0007B55D2D|nr:hypothetical protein [Lactiplantibacillus plantarum]
MAESNATQVILTDDGIKIINAQNTADNAASGVANLNDPNLMSVIEKQTQAAQYAGLTSQYNVVLAQAKEASISTTDLTTAYTNLNTFMSAILMDTTWGKKGGPQKIFPPGGKNFSPRGEKNFWGVFKKTPQKKGGPPFLKKPPGGFLKKPPGGFFPPFWGEKKGGPPKKFFPPGGKKIFPPGGKKIFGGFLKKPPKKRGAPLF